MIKKIRLLNNSGRSVSTSGKSLMALTISRWIASRFTLLYSSFTGIDHATRRRYYISGEAFNVRIQSMNQWRGYPGWTICAVSAPSPNRIIPGMRKLLNAPHHFNRHIHQLPSGAATSKLPPARQPAAS